MAMMPFIVIEIRCILRNTRIRIRRQHQHTTRAIPSLWPLKQNICPRAPIHTNILLTLTLITNRIIGTTLLATTVPATLSTPDTMVLAMANRAAAHSGRIRPITEDFGFRH